MLLLLASVLLLLNLGQTLEHKSQLDLNFEFEKKPGDKYYRANVKDEDVVQMYQKWVDTGLSSLMSAMAERK